MCQRKIVKLIFQCTTYC